MIKRIIAGLAITIISFLLLKHNEWLIRQTGTWYWAEKHLGTEGGTRLMLRLIALLGVIIGLLTVTGLHERFIKWILSPLFKIPLT
jgi:TRAP-type uncharacterized transport system fused permease subunit